MGKNLIPQWAFRAEKNIIDKLDYIAKFYQRNRNQQMIYLIKKEIARFENEHGEIKIEE